MISTPETGSSAVCPHCALKNRNQHSIRESGECDGIKDGKITGTRKLEIRMRNGGKKLKQEAEQ